MLAVLDAVAAAPPPRFSGGGLWEAMHGDMHGAITRCASRAHPTAASTGSSADWRIPVRRNWRSSACPGPRSRVITGLHKPWMTTFAETDYAAVRVIGEESLAQIPRRIAE
jgi:hypothetical protein